MEAIEARAALAGALDLTLAAMPDAVDRAAIDIGTFDPGQLDVFRSTRWSQWRHAEFWLGRLRRRAGAADHLVVVSPANRATAISLLGVEPERVTAVPNGVDTDRFRPLRMSAGARRDCFRRWLVDNPQGVGTSRACPAPCATGRLTSTGSSAPMVPARRSCSLVASPPPNECRCFCALWPGPGSGPNAQFRCWCGAAIPASGRASTLSPSPARSVSTAYFLPAGEATTTRPKVWPLATPSSWPGLGQRLVPPGTARGHGRWTAPDRLPQRRLPVDDQCRPLPAHRLAGGTRRHQRPSRRAGRGSRPSRRAGATRFSRLRPCSDQPVVGQSGRRL